MNKRLWNEHDLKLKHPCTCIISGPTGSGKSNFCIRFLQHLDSLCTETKFAGGIVWCFPADSSQPCCTVAMPHQHFVSTLLNCYYATTAFSNASVLLPCYNSIFSAHSGCLPLTSGRLPDPSTCAPTTVASTCCNTYLTSACNLLILTYT
jgi:hypothetical protein